VCGTFLRGAFGLTAGKLSRPESLIHHTEGQLMMTSDTAAAPLGARSTTVADLHH
jgi:hypothetical protein